MLNNSPITITYSFLLMIPASCRRHTLRLVFDQFTAAAGHPASNSHEYKYRKQPKLSDCCINILYENQPGTVPPGAGKAWPVPACLYKNVRSLSNSAPATGHAQHTCSSAKQTRPVRSAAKQKSKMIGDSYILQPQHGDGQAFPAPGGTVFAAVS